MNFLSQLFSGIGGAVIGPAEDAASTAFYVLAGELAVIIILLAGILLYGVAVL
jgi:hypothetical protein